jgi:hypothetical protein
LAAKQFLLVGDAVAPLVSGESPTSLSGISRALAAGGAQVTVISLADPAALSSVPGLARRLRTFSALSSSSGAREVPFFEGRAPLSQANFLVAGAAPANRGEAVGILADAVRAVAEQGLPKVDVAIGWGEAAAWALSFAPATSRVFVLPNGRVGAPLDDREFEVLSATGAFAQAVGSRSLAAVGAVYSNIIVAPSPCSAHLLENDEALAGRASDEPCVAVRFGADDPPFDPATDGTLVANFSPKAMAGKLECRRALTKRYSLTVGPRTLLLGIAPLRAGKGGLEVLKALPELAAIDVAVVVSPDGEPEILERVRRLAVQSPGRLTVMEADEASGRILRASADAVLFADTDDRTGRAPALAQRYGCLPIALDAAAGRDFLVDYEPMSRTGTAILFSGLEPWEIAGAVRRAVMLKNEPEGFPEVSKRLTELAPAWGQTASAFEEIAAQYS